MQEVAAPALLFFQRRGALSYAPLLGARDVGADGEAESDLLLVRIVCLRAAPPVPPCHAATSIAISIAIAIAVIATAIHAVIFMHNSEASQASLSESEARQAC
eukprot:746657-Hanusia_phi.AAC.1